jgi:hypothetical protein
MCFVVVVVVVFFFFEVCLIFNNIYIYIYKREIQYKSYFFLCLAFQISHVSLPDISVFCALMKYAYM